MNPSESKGVKEIKEIEVRYKDGNEVIYRGEKSIRRLLHSLEEKEPKASEIKGYSTMAINYGTSSMSAMELAKLMQKEASAHNSAFNS